MSTLKQRVEKIMPKGMKATELAQECKISRAAVSKWFNGRTRTIKADHAFKVARYCNVDAEWLATGRGARLRTTAVNFVRDDPGTLPSGCLEIVRKYQRLPEPARQTIRVLIDTLHNGLAGSSPRRTSDGADRRKNPRK